MKRLIGNILLFVISMTFVCYIYIGLFKISVVAFCILSLILALYTFCMTLSWKSMGELKKQAQKLVCYGLSKNDRSKILLLSLTTLSPTYFCVLLVSLVPLYTYEIWFITVFPCVFLNCLPASSVLEEYQGLTSKKLPFLLCFLMLTIVFCLMGMVTSSLIFKK